MFSKIEESYDKLPKHLNSGITNLFYGRNEKNAKILHLFWFLNLHNLLERACNHTKLYTFWKCNWKCLEITYSAIAKYPDVFFDALKANQNEKSYTFQETGIPEIHVWQFENFQNLITL